ncbi:TITAN-like protein [Linum perenne]
MKNSEKKLKRKNTKRAEFEFCKVCKLNHDHGNRHKYFPNHTKSLTTFLSRFQTKLSDIRFFLKNPSVLQPELASRNRFWCVFCDADIDEIGSSFACANAINHLASADHVKKLKHFLWKYGGGMDHVDNFRFSEADLAKWEKSCESLKDGASSCRVGTSGLQVGPSNDIQNGLNYKSINDFENNTFDPLTSKFDNNVMPLQYYTHEYQISQSALPDVSRVVCDANSSETGNVCAALDMWNSCDLIGLQNSHHYIPHNNAGGRNDLGNGGVSLRYYCIEGQRSVMYSC